MRQGLFLSAVFVRCAATVNYKTCNTRNRGLNLVQLSMAVASIPTGLIMKLARAPSAPLVRHGRKLNQVSVSSVAELTAAVGNSAVDKILVAAGTYEFTSDMCTGSAVCIDRALTIEAQVPGSVVLAKGGRISGPLRYFRVFEIQSGGTAKLIGLNITGGYGGYASWVQSVCLLNPSFPPAGDGRNVWAMAKCEHTSRAVLS